LSLTKATKRADQTSSQIVSLQGIRQMISSSCSHFQEYISIISALLATMINAFI
jgi:hypothetical protein